MVTLHKMYTEFMVFCIEQFPLLDLMVVRGKAIIQ